MRKLSTTNLTKVKEPHEVHLKTGKVLSVKFRKSYDDQVDDILFVFVLEDESEYSAWASEIAFGVSST